MMVMTEYTNCKKTVIAETSYEYDSVGNPVKETKNGFITTYTYNDLNQLTKKTNSYQIFILYL